MLCPRCKSNSVLISREHAGTSYMVNHMTTGVKRSWFIPSERSNVQSDSRYRTIAVCRECGYTWSLSDSQQGGNALTLILFLILVYFAHRFIAGDFGSTKNGTSPKNDPTVITTDQEIDTDKWSKEYTSIEDFKWEADEDGITLGRYKKNTSDNKIRFSDRYTINGEEYHITKLDTCFLCEDIKSVIVCEGVTYIDGPTFNSCGVRYLYLPESLEEFDGFGYLKYDLRELHYGGSEEEFYNKYDPKDNLDNVKMYFNVNPNDLQ